MKDLSKNDYPPTCAEYAFSSLFLLAVAGFLGWSAVGEHNWNEFADGWVGRAACGAGALLLGAAGAWHVRLALRLLRGRDGAPEARARRWERAVPRIVKYLVAWVFGVFGVGALLTVLVPGFVRWGANDNLWRIAAGGFGAFMCGASIYIIRRAPEHDMDALWRFLKGEE